MPAGDPAAIEWLKGLQDLSAAGLPPKADCVWLIGFPVGLGESQSERSQELMRELRILLIGRDRGDAGLRAPTRLVDLTDEFVAQFGGVIAGATTERQDAMVRGDDRIDLSYELTPGTRDLVVRYAEAMEEMDDYCRSGAVMTLPTPADMLALRRWIVEEFVRQYDGLPPRPWDGPL